MVTTDTIKHCFYCERPFNDKNYGTNRPLAKTRDHIIPVSKNGSNKLVNMVYSCIECNGFKCSLSLDYFVIKVQNYIDNKKGYKTIPLENLFTILGKIEILKAYVAEKGKALYRSGSEIIDILPKFENDSRRSIPKKIKELCADVSLSVNTNCRRQPEEKIIYLQSQTVEQFKERRRIDGIVRRQLSLPEPNFHEQE